MMTAQVLEFSIRTEPFERLRIAEGRMIAGVPESNR
jgi:hypothetical protein